MEWNDHHELEGQHAFLGASQYRWITWDDKTVEERFDGQYATEIGDALHLLAKKCITGRIKLTAKDRHLVEVCLYDAFIPKRSYDADLILANLAPFVNDAIGYHMDSEVLLFYSMNCFGTTDAIGCNEKEKTLRIFDYKSGTTPAHMEQLLIYAALFYLEYDKSPMEYKTELRIYQNCNALVYKPEPNEIERIMKLIKNRDKLVNDIREGKNVRIM